MKQSLPFVLLLALPLSAQVPHGHAVVCWKPQNPTATGGLRVVDRTGANAAVTGLSAATTGTTRYDGAQSVLVAGDGSVYAGLGVDNRTGGGPLPLDLRLILLSGSAAVSDTVFATLMQVPAGQVWEVSDIKPSRDGNFLVAASEVLFTANPMPQTTVFAVTSSGSVSALPATGFPAGSLLNVADVGGGMFVGAWMQQFFITNIELVLCSYTGTPAPVQIFQFVNQSRFGGMDLDLNGELVVGVPFGGSTVVRVAVAPSSTPTPVTPPTPASVAVCDVLPGPGLVALFTQPTLVAGSLNTVDSLVGGFTVWAQTVVRDPVDVSLRADTAVYGTASSTTGSSPYLGSSGGWPAINNAAFALRAGGTPGGGGIVLGSRGRAVIPTPFGTLWLDPTLLLAIGSFTLNGSGQATLPLPLPADPTLVGVLLDLQSIVVTSVAPITIEMSQGLELVVLAR
jgi:hypothetical protein